ncbi:hypothetical protein ABFS83_14G179700 [Erythranthe nasuta]
MAFSNMQLFVAFLLVLVPIATKGDTNIPPSLSPLFDNICNEVECGKGSCEAAPGKPFNYKCDCEDGWKRTRFDDEQDLEFVPCTIPNCTLDYSCMPAAPPAPAVPHNSSFFDPCYWIYCGEGKCTKNTTRAHTCQCNPGYSNLLNITAFPCYNDCAIGSESCERLGIRSASSTSNPSSKNNDNNQAIAFSMGKFNLMTILLATTATIFLKL